MNLSFTILVLEDSAPPTYSTNGKGGREMRIDLYNHGTTRWRTCPLQDEHLPFTTLKVGNCALALFGMGDCPAQ